jgi:ParB-like chromosome segregation protein Spo0J
MTAPNTEGPPEDRYQIMPELDAASDAALRDSIATHGVLVAVAHDQHGNTIDGHQRERIAAELGVPFAVDVYEVRDPDHARELARTLNEDRRQLFDIGQRRAEVNRLRALGHSQRAIADALGTTRATVRRDIDSGGPGGPPETVTGKDGKSYPVLAPIPTAPPVAAYSFGEVADAHAHMAALYAEADTPPGEAELVWLLARHRHFDRLGIWRGPEHVARDRAANVVLSERGGSSLTWKAALSMAVAANRVRDVDRDYPHLRVMYDRWIELGDGNGKSLVGPEWEARHDARIAEDEYERRIMYAAASAADGLEAYVDSVVYGGLTGLRPRHDSDERVVTAYLEAIADALV